MDAFRSNNWILESFTYQAFQFRALTCYWAQLHWYENKRAWISVKISSNRSRLNPEAISWPGGGNGREDDISSTSYLQWYHLTTYKGSSYIYIFIYTGGGQKSVCKRLGLLCAHRWPNDFNFCWYHLISPLIRGIHQKEREMWSFFRMNVHFCIFQAFKMPVSDFCAVHYVWPLMIRSSWKNGSSSYSDDGDIKHNV